MLLRRTRLALVAAPQLRDAESVLPVAAALGGELGWDEARIARRGRGRWPAELEPRRARDPAGARRSDRP